MIEAVAAHGYAATTVDEIVGLAGVSTKALYKQFSSKQECFLRTYDAVMEDLAVRIGAAWREGARSERDRTAGLSRGLEAFVQEVALRPQAARLALVEVLAAGPAVLGRIERAQLGFERIIAQGLAHASGWVEPPPLVARGVAGGLWYVTRARLLSGRTEPPAGPADELLRWMLAYSSASAQPLAPPLAPSDPTPASSRLTPLRRERMPDGDERARILWTTARIAAREGYGELSVARILDEAGVSDEVFFALYGGAEECFVAALELMSAQAFARVKRAGRTAPDWPAAVRATVGSLMRHIAADPVFARCAFLEIFAAGAAGAACRERMLRSLAKLLLRTVPEETTPIVAEAIVGAAWMIVHHEVVRGAAHTLPYLADQVAYIALAPLIGSERAAGTILDEGPADEERLAGDGLAPLPAGA